MMAPDLLKVEVGGFTYCCERPDRRAGVMVTLSVFDADGNHLGCDRINLDREKRRVAFATQCKVPPGDLLQVRAALLEHLDTPAASIAVPDDDLLTPAEEIEVLELLRAPNLFERLPALFAARGYAGDTRGLRVLYLVLTSRLQERPVNVVVTGPSSGGKSFAVRTVLDLFPTSASYPLSGMSDRVLVYTDADLRHRFLIIGEASALQRDGIGASLLRNLAWDGHVSYETVEKTTQGMQPKRLDKEGPTGFITTTTGSVESELNTRVLILNVPDDPAETRKILRATARRRSGQEPTVPDVRGWVNLQRWLASKGKREVVIPFAEALADAYPTRAVRARRDFTQLLGLIAASALLHQLQRATTADGRVLADERDYRAVYAIAGDVFGTLAGGASQPTRETVRAVEELLAAARAGDDPGKESVTVNEIAQALGLDKSTASRRVHRAIADGFLVNLEDKKGRPARIVLGDPLPAEGPALPWPDVVFAQSLPATLQPRNLPSDSADSWRAPAAVAPAEPQASREPLPGASSAPTSGRIQLLQPLLLPLAAQTDGDAGTETAPPVGGTPAVAPLHGCTRETGSFELEQPSDPAELFRSLSESGVLEAWDAPTFELDGRCYPARYIRQRAPEDVREWLESADPKQKERAAKLIAYLAAHAGSRGDMAAD